MLGILYTFWIFSLVCSGPLPGPMQNILRAETYALLQVLRQAVLCTVYCDNATVCQYFRDLLSEPFSLANWHTKADPDLWLEMSQLLFAMGPGLVWVQKVKAHLDVRHAQSDHEAWCILGNSQADAFAKKAQKTALQARLALQHKHHINSCRQSLKHLPRIWGHTFRRLVKRVSPVAGTSSRLSRYLLLLHGIRRFLL